MRFIDVGTIEAHVFEAGKLHFIIDCSGDDVARCKGATGIVVLHKFSSIGPLQDGAFATNGFADQEGLGIEARVVERRWVELDKLHIFQVDLGAVGHRDAISRSDDGVGGAAVDLPVAAGGQDGVAGQNAVNLPRFAVENVTAVALNIWCKTGNDIADVVLGEEIEGEEMLVHNEVIQRCRLRAERALDLPAGEVFVVKDAVFGVAAFTAQVVFLELVGIETGTPLDNFFYTRWAFFNDDADDVFVAEPRPCVKGIRNMFFVVIGAVVPYRSYSSLGVTGVALPLVDLGQDVDLKVRAEDGQLDAGAEPGNSGADDEDVCF